MKKRKRFSLKNNSNTKKKFWPWSKHDDSSKQSIYKILGRGVHQEKWRFSKAKTFKNPSHKTVAMKRFNGLVSGGDIRGRGQNAKMDTETYINAEAELETFRILRQLFPDWRFLFLRCLLTLFVHKSIKYDFGSGMGKNQKNATALHYVQPVFSRINICLNLKNCRKLWRIGGNCDKLPQISIPPRVQGLVTPAPVGGGSVGGGSQASTNERERRYWRLQA